jgi:uncharacterized coiled-coil DUF342 family protein
VLIYIVGGEILNLINEIKSIELLDEIVKYLSLLSKTRAIQVNLEKKLLQNIGKTRQALAQAQPISVRNEETHRLGLDMEGQGMQG